jgi:hypothetical protein
MERLTGGITMHRPVTAPTVVLALGNDFEFWAIKAAREWPVGIKGVAGREFLISSQILSFRGFRTPPSPPLSIYGMFKSRSRALILNLYIRQLYPRYTLCCSCALYLSLWHPLCK